MKQRLIVHADIVQSTIHRNIYGHFSEHLGRCIYEGLWVGEDSPIPNTDGLRNDVLDALRQIQIPVLRWPGGCFADEYHWRDGVGMREQRKRMVNTHWGGVVENNHFGTHEFLHLCELLECEPYINGNVGSGTVQEMQEWIEYVTFDGESPMAEWRRKNGRDQPWKLKYFGIGNENWGCGGHMRPEYYADLFRRYQTYVRNYGENRIYKIAGGANIDDYHWTDVLMREAGRFMDGISLHYYTIPGDFWTGKGSATDFDQGEWSVTMKKALYMDELITNHCTIMDRYDPGKRVGLIVDEWGTWYDVEPGTNPGFLYQQNTLRDALVAGVTLNIFHKHADRVHMANIAQTANVLQSMVLTEGDKMVLTPTYHVFDMFKVHQDAKRLTWDFTSNTYDHGHSTVPQVSVSASMDANDAVHISLCNLDDSEPAQIQISFRGGTLRTASGTILTDTDMQAHNTFAKPEAVKPKDFHDFMIEAGDLNVTLPPMCVVVLEIN